MAATYQKHCQIDELHLQALLLCMFCVEIEHLRPACIVEATPTNETMIRISKATSGQNTSTNFTLAKFFACANLRLWP